MTEHGYQRVSGAAAWLWAGAVLILALHQIDFWRAPRLDTDVLALLPGEQRDPVLERAQQRIGEHAMRQVVVLIHADDWAGTARAATAFLAHIESAKLPLELVASDEAALQQAVRFLAPHRGELLTARQRERLQDSAPEALARSALSRLFAPGPGSAIGRWQDDPLGLWPEWWQERAGQGLQLRDGLLNLHRDGRDWALLRFSHLRSAFQLDGARRLQDALDAAAAVARVEAPSVRILRGGVPLHAEAAAAQANREVTIIGVGSLAAVLLLLWLSFGRMRAIALVATSLVIGCAAGLSATAWWFGQVHVLTLVFGASLVGVAEDYGIHYFAARQAHPQVASRALMRRLLPGMTLALVTSVLAYLALGAAPFPGLRQMAVFSAVGLGAAFLTVVLWFPRIDMSAPRSTAFASGVAGTLSWWPRLRNRTAAGLTLLLLAAALGGWFVLRADDSLRSLQNAAPELREQEVELNRLLGLPSPAQFFLLEASDEDTLLQREEALTRRLGAQVEAGELGGWRALSDWLPSSARRRDNRALSQPAEILAREQAAEWLGEEAERDDAIRPALDLGALLALDLAQPLRPLWLGGGNAQPASAVLLEGVDAQTDLDTLDRLARSIPGVRFVDKSAQVTGLLRHYRIAIGWLLVLGYVAVAVALYVRYRTAAWRALLPTALAALLSVAVLAWFGQPLQLFSVLAQLLLLGIGVDYGIFLLEHRDDPASWLAVSLGAASTWLAFGLLGLSQTPALRSFGLTLMVGIALVWLLSPLFRPAKAVSSPATS